MKKSNTKNPISRKIKSKSDTKKVFYVPVGKMKEEDVLELIKQMYVPFISKSKKTKANIGIIPRGYGKK